MSPRRGSETRREGDRTSQPAAHAAGYVMPPLRGSELRGVCDKPAAHAAGYVMPPLRGSELRGVCDKPAAHAAGYVMPPLRGSELRGVCDKPAAHAAGYVMPPLRGSELRGVCDKPAAHAAGYVMPPLRGSEPRGVCDKPAAHAAGYVMPPRWGSELRGVCDKPAAHAAGYVMPPLRGSVDEPVHCLTPATGHNAHAPSYFAHARPEILALIPQTARAVLDVGCGAGRLGEALKARQQAEVCGIELNEAAAAAARTRLDRVFVGDVETLDLPFSLACFDAIVCGDILEHLREPDRLLRLAKEWLKPDGTLVASIPNVRHHSVVRSLLEGNWTYEPAGLLDRTHLRFFTRREIEKLFFRAGFAIEEMRSVIGPADREAVDKLRGTVQVGRLSIGGLSEQEAAEFYTYQFLLRAASGVARIRHDVD